MIDKGLKVGDYILITDTYDENYLLIGVIKSITENGERNYYDVTFRSPVIVKSGTEINLRNRGKRKTYDNNLSERCKVLCFKEEDNDE